MNDNKSSEGKVKHKGLKRQIIFVAIGGFFGTVTGVGTIAYSYYSKYGHINAFMIKMLIFITIVTIIVGTLAAGFGILWPRR